MWNGENTETVQSAKSEREKLCPYVKLWKHLNYTICIIWDKERERERDREKEREIEGRLCPYLKLWKHWNCTICIIQEREAMSICEMVKTLKLYYLCNTRERDRDRERGGYVHMWNSFLIWDTPSLWYCTFLWMAWLRGVDLPNLNSSWPQDVSMGG